eukprot:513112-Pyramimonas_sp.AAC.1
MGRGARAIGVRDTGSMRRGRAEAARAVRRRAGPPDWEWRRVQAPGLREPQRLRATWQVGKA